MPPGWGELPQPPGWLCRCLAVRDTEDYRRTPLSRSGQAGIGLTLSGGAAGQGGSEAVFRYPPEVVLDAVHERDRDLLPVLTQIVLGLGDVTLLPGHAEILGHPADDLARVVAEVTAWPAEQRDSGRGHLASSVPLVSSGPLAQVRGLTPVR